MLDGTAECIYSFHIRAFNKDLFLCPITSSAKLTSSSHYPMSMYSVWISNSLSSQNWRNWWRNITTFYLYRKLNGWNFLSSFGVSVCRCEWWTRVCVFVCMFVYMCVPERVPAAVCRMDNRYMNVEYFSGWNKLGNVFERNHLTVGFWMPENVEWALEEHGFF